MAERKDGGEWGIFSPPEPSPAQQDPYCNVAAAVLVQSLRDLKGRDPVNFLDSLSWLLYGDAALYLQALGYPEIDGRDILRLAVLGGAPGGQKL
jgi:hypothetical protein